MYTVIISLYNYELYVPCTERHVKCHEKCKTRPSTLLYCIATRSSVDQWPWPRTESCWSGSVWLSIGSLQQHKLYSNTHKCLGHDSRGSAWLSIGSSLQPHELYSNTHKCLGHDSRGSVIAYFWHCMVTGERWEQRITKMGICTFLHYRVFALKACSLNASKKRKAFIWPKISR